MRDRRPLSAHFYVYELFPDGPPPDRMEMYLARHLAHNVLEVLRDIAQQPLRVTDGRRLWQTHLEYVRKDYKPSLTSDHSYGPGFLNWGSFESEVNRGPREFPGSWFHGAGAADVKPVRKGRRRNWTMAEYEEARHRLVDTRCGKPNTPAGHTRGMNLGNGQFAGCDCNIGQLIYYPVRGHIHVSNNRSVVLSSRAIGELGLPAQRGPAYVYPEK